MQDLRASCAASPQVTNDASLVVEEDAADMDMITLSENSKLKGLQSNSNLQIDNFVSEDEDLYIPYSIAKVPDAPSALSPRVAVPSLKIPSDVPPPPPIEDLHFDSDEEEVMEDRVEVYPEEADIPPRARAIFEEFARTHITDWVIEGCKRSYEDVEDFSLIE